MHTTHKNALRCCKYGAEPRYYRAGRMSMYGYPYKWPTTNDLHLIRSDAPTGHIVPSHCFFPTSDLTRLTRADGPEHCGGCALRDGKPPPATMAGAHAGEDPSNLRVGKNKRRSYPRPSPKIAPQIERRNLGESEHENFGNNVQCTSYSTSYRSTNSTYGS